MLFRSPDLLDTLARPELACLSQRLLIRSRLEPLGLEEGMDYVLHHLRLAGGRPEMLIDESSLEILARGTKGVPRLLNQAVHQALMLAHSAEMSQIDAEAALEALALLGLEVDDNQECSINQDEQEETHQDLNLGIVGGDFETGTTRIHPFETPRPA